ncbi:hypothetical protein DAEQUDRAFT_747909 [Daedalea quercina L-15889]|uniref:Uncharacterized protein n=1 Tax=Daedalea quercina L-15889 TaxID=1314783 RepID=A0A165KJ05_9APHY|nr:hypothetical protein DAEQUDRAFT_747909 [Daedalea quercina L-15889]
MSTAKMGYICAKDIVDFVSTPEMHEKLGGKMTISEWTARRWLHKLDWRYKKLTNGMYIDGHECPDFGFPVPGGHPFHLITQTQDESIYYAHNRRKTKWTHSSERPKPVCKGEGPLIMPGKNCDGYFSMDEPLEQVDKAIDIFEARMNGFATGLWLFDNAPSHQKRAADALSAHYMLKNPLQTWVPKGGAHMRPGQLPNGLLQHFYFPDDYPQYPGWFKGMEMIIQEHGLWPDDGWLKVQCNGFNFIQS